MVTVVILLALVGFLIIGVFAARGLRLTAYSSNRRRSSFADVLFTILGSLVGGWMFFGLAAMGFEAGIVGYFIGVGYAIGLIGLALAAPRIKAAMTAHDSDTLDDLLGVRLGQRVQIIVTFTNLLFFLAVLAAQFVAMAAFLRVFTAIEGPVAFYAAVLVVIAYTALAGFKGVVITDLWQFVVLSLSAVTIFSLLATHTDMSAVFALEPKYFNGTGYGAAFLVGVFVFFPPSILARTDLWQRIASARDAQIAKKALLISAPILLVFYFLLTTIGIFARAALGPDVEPAASGFIYFLSIVQPDPSVAVSTGANIFLSIMALGVFAALLSTADTNLNIVSISLSKILRPADWRRFERETTEKEVGQRTDLESRLLNTSRLMTVALGCLAVIVARMLPDIVDLMVGAASAVMVFLPAVISAVFLGKRNPTAAFTSIALGLVVLVVLLAIAPKTAFLPATVASFVGYFLVSRFVPSSAIGTTEGAS